MTANTTKIYVTPFEATATLETAQGSWTLTALPESGDWFNLADAEAKASFLARILETSVPVLFQWQGELRGRLEMAHATLCAGWEASAAADEVDRLEPEMPRSAAHAMKIFHRRQDVKGRALDRRRKVTAAYQQELLAALRPILPGVDEELVLQLAATFASRMTSEASI